MHTIFTSIRTVDPRVCTSCLFLVLCGLLALYMYLVGMSVVHVVMNKEANQQIGMIKSDISELESAYIDAQHAVRAELALQDGFVNQEEKVFIVSSDTTVVVSRDE